MSEGGGRDTPWAHFTEYIGYDKLPIIEKITKRREEVRDLERKVCVALGIGDLIVGEQRVFTPDFFKEKLISATADFFGEVPRDFRGDSLQLWENQVLENLYKAVSRCKSADTVDIGTEHELSRAELAEQSYFEAIISLGAALTTLNIFKKYTEKLSAIGGTKR